MKKKILIGVMLFLTLGMISGCSKTEEQHEASEMALKFKEDYESVNGTTNSNGKLHRTITISEDNPFIMATAEEIVEKIENKETFYVYFGSKLCPWCRSVIESAIKTAKENNIKSIYYVDIWDDDGNEILRDKYSIIDNELKLEINGTTAYYDLLNLLDTVLQDYTLVDENNNVINTKEKRIYAPYFIYIENGEAIKATEGISEKQTDSRSELTEEILTDEKKQFNDFFNN